MNEDRNPIDDEARWLAACLADESARADRVLNDPFASHLAGAGGARFLAEPAATPRTLAVVLAVATADELLRRTVLDHHLHAVLHLGAGLDTRPYRLQLPNDLRWMELDRDPVILYKAFRLAHVSPTCRIHRVSVDLSDRSARDRALKRAARGVARGLLVTENVLDRFTFDVLLDLGARLPAGIKWWLLGKPSRTPVAEEDAMAALCDVRWTIADRRRLIDEARRLIPDRQATIGPPELGAIWLLRRKG